MHILLVRLLQGVAIALILALGRVLKFALKCLLARRSFLASDLPGPPLPSALLGEAGWGLSWCMQAAAGAYWVEMRGWAGHGVSLSSACQPGMPLSLIPACMLLFKTPTPTRTQSLLASPPSGHVPSIMGAKGAWTLSAWASQYGPLFKIMFLNQSAAVLTDPDAIARLTKRAGV